MIWNKLLLLTTLVASLACPVFADEAAEDAPESSILIAPYAWAPSLEGAIGIAGLEVPLEIDINELADGVEIGAMGYLRWQRGRHFFYSEALGLKFSDSEFEPLFDHDVAADLRFVEVGYGQQLDFSWQGYPYRVLPYVGVRYLRLGVDVEGILGNIKSTEKWMDLALGMIVSVPLGDRFSASAKLDGAGFDLAYSRYWNVIVGVDYHFNEAWSVSVGYRYAEFVSDAESGHTLSLDMTGGGAIAGLQFEF